MIVGDFYTDFLGGNREVRERNHTYAFCKHTHSSTFPPRRAEGRPPVSCVNAGMFDSSVVIAPCGPSRVPEGRQGERRLPSLLGFTMFRLHNSAISLKLIDSF